MVQRAVEFWCRLSLPLETVFDRFCAAFPVDEHNRDSENVWEWFAGTTQDGLVDFNITRQWGEDFIPDEPIRFMLKVDSALNNDQIGERLASVMGTQVHTGIVTYLQGDDFDFKVDALTASSISRTPS